jgi:16S rRNA (guanine966-N2)-methyltransferase
MCCYASQVAAKAQEVRIIAGRHRGRRLRFPKDTTVRPTPDRVRETLFNWLAPHLAGARVLDAFAGSGALGIEALSRGAAFALLLDRDPQCVHAIREQLTEWQVAPAQFVAQRADALKWLAAGRPPEMPPFEIVFLDPPFDQALWSSAIAALERGAWLAPSALVYLERPARTMDDLSLGLSSHWQLWREGKAGEVGYDLYHYNNAQETGA